MTDDRHRDDVGAYLLGALPDDEARAFERHLEECERCRAELDELRPAADLLPGDVEQLAPPASLKASLMEVVEREACDRGAPGARRPSPMRRLGRLVASRPALAWAAAGALLLAGLVGGFGLAQLGSDGGTRTLKAAVDQRRLPDVSGRLTLPDGGGEGGLLTLNRLPAPGRGRVYQAWVQRGGTVVPQPTFVPGPGGEGAVAIPADLEAASAVLVTRERRGGARTPSERPVVRVAL